MISSIISRLVILVFGTLYPAYASYKAVKSKNVKEYVKWMMYWIVFALFTCAETITDVFLSWFPFYYEIKIILVVWLLSPATKGSSFLYRKFVHPMLSSKEQEIDEYITKAKEQSYKQVLDLGQKGVNALMQTAIKGGGGLVNQIKKSYSLSDLSDRHSRDEDGDETDISDPRLLRKRQSPRRTPTTSMYFSEIDIRTDPIISVQSAEDLSSGYSSSEGLAHQTLKLQAREALVRTASVGSNKTRPTRVTRSTVVPKKIEEGEEEANVSNEDDDEYMNYTITQPLNSKKISVEIEKITDSSSEGDYEDPMDYAGNFDDIITPKTNEAVETSLIDVPDQPGTNKQIVQEFDNRAGKYHKKAAPPVPSTIKATLILKPGIVKPLPEDNGEVFCYSPKLKRKSRSKSPSPNLEVKTRNRSKSPALKLIKNKSPLLGKKFESFMNFPKKIGFFKHESENYKRTSWYDGINLLKVPGGSKMNLDQSTNDRTMEASINSKIDDEGESSTKVVLNQDPTIGD